MPRWKYYKLIVTKQKQKSEQLKHYIVFLYNIYAGHSSGTVWMGYIMVMHGFTKALNKSFET